MACSASRLFCGVLSPALFHACSRFESPIATLHLDNALHNVCSAALRRLCCWSSMLPFDRYFPVQRQHFQAQVPGIAAGLGPQL